MMIVTVNLQDRPVTGTWLGPEKTMIAEAAKQGPEKLAAVISLVPGPQGPALDIGALPPAP